MGLIKNLSEYLALKQEERAVVRELAQERIAKKRAELAKLKEFNDMLDMRLPCESVIRLKKFNGEVQYFQIGANVITLLFLLQEGFENFHCRFKQLTGDNVGQVYTIKCPTPPNTGFFHCQLNERDRSKLAVSIMGHINDQLEQHFCEPTELEKQYGKTISIRELLLLWKADNGQEKTIDINEDYEMVKTLYNSENILLHDKEQTINK